MCRVYIVWCKYIGVCEKNQFSFQFYLFFAYTSIYRSSMMREPLTLPVSLRSLFYTHSFNKVNFSRFERMFLYGENSLRFKHIIQTTYLHYYAVPIFRKLFPSEKNSVSHIPTVRYLPMNFVFSIHALELLYIRPMA